MQEITLNNQVTVPQLGLGVFQIEDDNILKDAVKAAIKDGYRHFDTATLYKNEQALGEALADSGVPRDELFVTSKVWNTVTTYDGTCRF